MFPVHGQLVEETGYSKSTVSTNMGILERIGLVKRVVIPGDKEISLYSSHRCRFVEGRYDEPTSARICNAY